MGEDAIRKIGVGSSIILVGFFIGLFFQYMIKILLARFLGPEVYGVFIQALAVTEIAAIVSMLGMHKGVPRFISYYGGMEEKEILENPISTSLYFVLPTSIVVSLSVFLLSERISIGFFSEPALVEPLKIFSITIVPLAIIYLFVSFFRGKQLAKYKVYLKDFALSGLVFVCVSAAVIIGLSVEAVAYGYLLAEILAVFAGYYFYRKIFNEKLVATRNLIPRKLMSFSWPLFIVSIVVVANKWLSVWMLGWITDSTSVGIYGAAYSISSALGFLLGALTFMFMPVVSELHAEGKKSEILDVYSNSTRWIVLGSAPLLAGIMIFPHEILELLFGSSYVSGDNVLRVLAAGYFYLAFTGPSGELLVSTGHTKRRMIGFSAIMAITGLVNLLLIPSMGVMGAAIGTASGLIVGHSILLGFTFNSLGSSPYSKRYLSILLSVLVASLPIYGLKLVIEPGLILSVVMGGLLVLIYLLVLYISGGIQEEDERMFWAVFNALPLIERG